MLIEVNFELFGGRKCAASSAIPVLGKALIERDNVITKAKLKAFEVLNANYYAPQKVQKWDKGGIAGRINR